jgi:dUTPase
MALKIEIIVVDPRIRDWGLPAFASDHASAIDLRACIPAPLELRPDAAPEKIGAGVRFHIADPNVTGLVVPRSGTGNRGLMIANTVGVIDPDYQGQVFVSAWNRNAPGTPPLLIEPGERIAQMLFVPILRPVFEVVEEFSSETARGEGGFGSTGKTG